MNKTLKTLVSRHPQPHLQRVWTIFQLGLLIVPVIPIIGTLSLILSVLIAWWQEYRIIRQRPVNWGLLILGGWLIITCFFAYIPTEAYLGLANLLPFFIVFAGFSAIIQDFAQLRHIAKLIVIGALPVVILGLGQLFWGWSAKGPLLTILGWELVPQGNPPGRMASVFMHANILAAYLQIVFILGLGLWVEAFQGLRQRGNSTSIRWFGFLSVAMIGNAIALIFTNSRNAWGIAIFAGLAFALYLGWRWIVLAVMAAAGTILWASFGPEFGRQSLRQIVPAFFWARLTDQLHPNRPIALMRKTQWQFTLNMIQERPWVGWGLRNFTPLYEAKMQLWLNHPHNLLLMLMAETGIPATLLFFGLVGWILAQAVWLCRVGLGVKTAKDEPHWQHHRLILFTYLVAFGGCILFNSVDVTVFDLRVNTLGWLILSAICGVVYQHQRGTQPHGL
jgi:O-antigen ligase